MEKEIHSIIAKLQKRMDDQKAEQILTHDKVRKAMREVMEGYSSKPRSVVLTLHIGKLIEKAEITIPDGLPTEEQQRLENECLQLLPELREKMMQSIASFAKHATSVLGEGFAVQLHLK